MNDAELLQRYVTAGDEDAFATLVARHLPLVYGAALRQLGNPALAQEVAQSTFVRLARRAVWLTGHPSLAGWLYRTSVHLAQHEVRAECRRRRRDQIALELGVTLGADERTIAFMTATEKDGSHAVWYGIADPRHGGGSFQRVGPDLAPDSQIAYYANLLGVQLP